MGEPSSLDSLRSTGHGSAALVQLESAVLDVSGPLRDGFPGEELSRTDGGRPLRTGLDDVQQCLLLTAHRIGTAEFGEQRISGISPQHPKEKWPFLPAVFEFGAAGVRLDLRFVLRVRLDPGVVFPARKTTRAR